MYVLYFEFDDYRQIALFLFLWSFPFSRRFHVWGDAEAWGSWNFPDDGQGFLKRVSELIRFSRDTVDPATGGTGPMSAEMQQVLNAPDKVLDEAQVALDNMFADLWVKPSFLDHSILDAGGRAARNLDALQKACIDFLLVTLKQVPGGLWTKSVNAAIQKIGARNYLTKYWCVGVRV